MERYFSLPEKIEMVDGKLLDYDEDRERLLCMLLENVGADRVVQFGSPEVWRAAIAQAPALTDTTAPAIFPPRLGDDFRTGNRVG